MWRPKVGPARKRRGCLLLLIFLLPIMLHAISLMFPAAEVFEHYDQLDRERKMELEENNQRSLPRKSGSQGR